MNQKNALGQFYTPSNIAELVVEKALGLVSAPRTAIELAAGEGHLLVALNEKSVKTEIYAIDIDADNCKKIKKKHPNFYVYNADTTKDLSFLYDDFFDLALGNPPFLSNTLVNTDLNVLLKEVLGIDIKIGKKVRVEYVFIAKYLKLLKEGGVLAIILPESIISGARAEHFRKAISERVEILELLELSGNPFISTEAKTHVLFLRKSSRANKNIKISKLEECNGISSRYILKDDAIFRMDYSYHFVKNVTSHVEEQKARILSTYAEISRGKYTHKILKTLNNDYIHSTNFNLNHSHSNKPEVGPDYVLHGDIIMCRVGSRVVGKAREYLGDPVLYSDCIYKIRFKDKKMKFLFMDYINSIKGFNKIKSISRGVCARYITKSDLESLWF